MTATPLWISEAEVVELMDLSDAIAALESALRLEADGGARNMTKTHVSWGQGDSLHALGAAFDAIGVVGTKTWAHTEGGATPLLILWDARSGALQAIIEAFALGQMRTGAISGVATRWMARKDAEIFALVGTGRQALAQLAAVAAVRTLREVRVWGRDPAKRSSCARAAEALGYGFAITQCERVEEAVADAAVITLATRAREPFLTAAMAPSGAHINAIGAISPDRQELARDVLARADLIATDDAAAARKFSRELISFFGSDEDQWASVRPLSRLVASGAARPLGMDLSVFKPMGMGVSDLALGTELLRLARAKGLGRAIEPPRNRAPRLQARLYRGAA